MSSLNGARVALLEGRMSGELAGLVQRHGGQPCCVPAVREAPLECGPREVALIEELAAGSFAVGVFLTGVGVKALFQAAERLSCLAGLEAALHRMTLVCRGPKPSAVVRAHKLPVAICAPEPYTTAELIAAMAALDLADVPVLLLHYGERSAALAGALQARGARIAELCLYEWQLPESCWPLWNLVREIIDGEIDAIAFTSQVQVRHLFEIAAGAGMQDVLAQALNTRTVVASVGPTCTAALLERGVTPQVEPEHPKMGPMIVALARYWEACHAANIVERAM